MVTTSREQAVAETVPRPTARILLVTRRFWPLCDDSAGRLAVLAEGLRRSGIEPTILAARYSNAWPTEIAFREIEVLRPVQAPRSDWTTGLYNRGLIRWLRDHASQFSLLYADSAGEEGAAVVETAEHCELPAVVRCGGSGSNGDWLRAADSRTARKAFNASLRASGLIAPTASVNRALVSAGADRERIYRIADGVPLAIRREKVDQLAARAALAAVNSDMRVPGSCRVILVHGRFDVEHSVLFVARALAPLCHAEHDIRIWFIGDGAQREALHHYCLQMGVRSLVAMPGSFWHIEELVRAADIAVFPTDCDALEHRLPQAIAGSVPIVVCDSSEMKSYFADLRGSGVKIPTFRNQSQESLRAVVAEMLDAYEDSQRNAIELRNVMRRTQSREKSIEEHGRLFASFLARAPRKQDRSLDDEEAGS